MHPGDMAAQVGQALDNLETVLRQAGFALADVVRLNVYTTDVDAFLGALGAVGRAWRAGCRFASTLLGVTRLASPELLVELEATAQGSAPPAPGAPAEAGRHRSRDLIRVNACVENIFGSHVLPPRREPIGAGCPCPPSAWQRRQQHRAGADAGQQRETRAGPTGAGEARRAAAGVAPARSGCPGSGCTHRLPSGPVTMW